MARPHDTEPTAAPALPIAIGEIVAGKYRVERLVGLGGMAAVVAGTHVELQQPVAIKLLLPERAMQPDAVRRFLSEARAAAKLKGEHVVRISDVGTTTTSNGPVLPYLVMELLEGHDLATVLEQRGRLTTTDAVTYVLQACSAIAEAHALGIVHRDVKPANLFLTTRGRDGMPILKLLDFGIAKTIERSQAADEGAKTGENEAMGSPSYMSPEQVRGAKDVDLRTDIWSLGVVLHELLTGTDAFSGETLNEIFVSVLHSPPHPIRELAPEVPEAICAIVEKCLQKKADRRFQTIAELTTALSNASSAAAPAFLRRPESLPDVIPVARPHTSLRGILVLVAAAIATVAVLALILGLGRTQLRATTAPAVTTSPSDTTAEPSAAPMATTADNTPTNGTIQPDEPPIDDLDSPDNVTPSHKAPANARPRAAVRPLGAKNKPATTAGAPTSSQQHRTPW